MNRRLPDGFWGVMLLAISVAGITTTIILGHFIVWLFSLGLGPLFVLVILMAVVAFFWHDSDDHQPAPVPLDNRI